MKRWLRKYSAFLRRTRAKIVYRHEYLTTIHARNAHQTYDVMRFKKIRDQLIQEGLIRRRDILKAEMVSEEDLLRVHTRNYIESLKNPMIVGEILNLDYVNPWDNYILEYFKYITGGTILAADYALEHRLPVFNLGGGYHHAHRDRGEGFCLINDVAVAIEKLRSEKKLQRVLVVDLDYHQGNGIILIYQDDPDVFTFSIHANKWTDVKKVNSLDIELPAHVKDEQYLQTLREHLPGVFQQFSPELVIYLAGSDPYEKDTLGDFEISEAGMLQRDIFVYQLVKAHQVPLTILAAGGYGPESWKVYYNFIKWVLLKG